MISDKNWLVTVRNLCLAQGNLDGVLVLTNDNDQFHVKVFNSDGSDGQVCLNGARCVAHHLYQEGYEGKELKIFMGKKVIENKGLTQYIELGSYAIPKTIETPAGIFVGHVVDVSNPHFIVFAKQTREWLEKNGQHLSKHPNFPKQTNIEFVWPHKSEKNKYNVLVYERGCGVTQACSSGAAAITTLLFEQNKIEIDEKITLLMLGGSLQTWITKNKKIALQANKPPETFS